MPKNIHATCIRVAAAGKSFGTPPSAGVLLLGKSGAGKSDLALRLIARGARLVSDDRTDLSLVRGRLVASAPKAIAGLLEVRGVGIVKMARPQPTAVSLVVDLSGKAQRLPEDRRYRPPFEIDDTACPPLISLDPFEAAAPEKILIAVAAHLRKRLVR